MNSKIKEQVEAVFNTLQELNIEPTPHNVSILYGVYEVLRGLYNKIGDDENAGDTEHGAASDIQ